MAGREGRWLAAAPAGVTRATAMCDVPNAFFGKSRRSVRTGRLRTL
jgi:hypothetical protein